MTTLNREQIIEATNKVKNGTIARVTYKTEVPLKAEFKKQGYKMIKITETSARFGVNYGHISSVIARNAEKQLEEAVQRTNNYEWVIKNKVKYNTKTDREYLVLANFNKGHNTKSKYLLEGTFVGTIDMGDSIDSHYTHLVIDSYYKKPDHYGEVKTIAFDNILRINDVGQKISF
jgi:hypothetical protein